MRAREIMFDGALEGGAGRVVGVQDLGGGGEKGEGGEGGEGVEGYEEEGAMRGRW